MKSRRKAQKMKTHRKSKYEDFEEEQDEGTSDAGGNEDDSHADNPPHNRMKYLYKTTVHASNITGLH